MVCICLFVPGYSPIFSCLEGPLGLHVSFSLHLCLQEELALITPLCQSTASEGGSRQKLDESDAKYKHICINSIPCLFTEMEEIVYSSPSPTQPPTSSLSQSTILVWFASWVPGNIVSNWIYKEVFLKGSLTQSSWPTGNGWKGTSKKCWTSFNTMMVLMMSSSFLTKL